MVQSLRRMHTHAANPREFEASELNEPTLESSDQWYELFAVQGDTTTVFGAGFGPDDDRRNSDGWSDLDLKGTDSSDSVVDVAGRVRYRIYRDSSKDDLIAQSGTYSVSSLRSAVAAGRKDKSLIPGLLSKAAGNDSFMTVEIKPKASSEGVTVSAADSETEQGLAYSELPV